MTRFNDILNGIKQATEAAQKTYKGTKRSDLKDSDFLFPETRSFPIVTPQDIPDAISNFGRMKGPMTYDAFIKKLYNMAKRKGPEFVAALPKATKEKLGIKTAKAECDPDDSPEECEKEKLEDKLELEMIKQKLKEIQAYENNNIYPEIEYEDDRLSLISQNEKSMDEYKQSYYDMSVGSLRAIMNHAKDILEYLDNPMVKENLTAPHLQGIIAVAEDHMRGIHDFVMYVETDDDDYEEDEDEDEEEVESVVEPVGPQQKKRKKVKISDLPHYEYQYKPYPGVTTPQHLMSQERPGLWENIRKKKEREGKKYRPAKPGDKDRPDPEQWKKLTK